MFIGSINQDLRSVIASLAKHWHGLPVYVGCSGNFTIERILAKDGVQDIHSNDVSLYSCALGCHLSGQPFRLSVREPSLAWLETYLQPGLPSVATLLLCTTVLDFWGKDHPYHRRMWDAYVKRWPQLHADTVEKLKTATQGLTLKSFHAGDVVDFLGAVPQDSVVIAFPPTYCLAPDERVLTADLRWVPCGDLRVGDRLLSFDEHNGGISRRRRWAWGTVTRSEPATATCVRIYLANGQCVTCSANHPWLSDPGHSGPARRWRRADSLAGFYTLKTFDTWVESSSFNAGWLSGIMDGEGCLNIAYEHAALSITQKVGLVASAIGPRLAAEGITVQNHRHDGAGNGMTSTVVGGGFRQVVKTLGMLRPMRLLARFESSDISCRAVHAERVKVELVEPIGQHAIQSVTVDRGTYVGEGYLMHNSSGYERLYKKLHAVFDWDQPTYELFTAERFQALAESMTKKRHWCVLRDEPLTGLGDPIAKVQTGMRSKPVWVYSNGPASVLTLPRQKLENVPWARISGPPTLPITLVELTQGQVDTLRSQYLVGNITPVSAEIRFGCLANGELFGAFAVAIRSGKGCGDNSGLWRDAYMVADFAVQSNIQRLSKLVLAVVLSKEVQSILEQRIVTKVQLIGTTAFTDKPASMKYRGLFQLHSRKEGRLNYVAQAGRWTLAEGFAWWQKKYGTATTETGHE